MLMGESDVDGGACWGLRWNGNEKRAMRVGKIEMRKE